MSSNMYLRPRSALKRSDSARGQRRRTVLWDEVNLDENEKVKQQFANVHVVEPKTPYHGPMDEAEADADLEPLALDEVDEERGPGAAALPNGLHAGTSGSSSSSSSAMEVDAASCSGTASGSGVAGGRGSSMNGSAGPAEHAAVVSSNGVPHGAGDDDENDDEEDEGPGHVEGGPKRHFSEKRKAHYNMRQALVQAQELLSLEEQNALEAGSQGS